MMESRINALKILFLLFSATVLIVAIGAAISSIDNIASSAQRSVVNYDDISLDKEVSGNVYNNAMNKISARVRSLNNLDNNPDIIYRSITLKRIGKTNSYSLDGLIDVPSIKQSYKLGGSTDGIFLQCPSPDLSNYPDSFCIGAVESYEDDSIYALFGLDLPMDGILDNGTKIRVYQKNHQINAHIYSCESDSLKQKTTEYIKKLVADRGGNPSIFPISYSFNSCK